MAGVSAPLGACSCVPLLVEGSAETGGAPPALCTTLVLEEGTLLLVGLGSFLEVGAGENIELESCSAGMMLGSGVGRPGSDVVLVGAMLFSSAGVECVDGNAAVCGLVTVHTFHVVLSGASSTGSLLSNNLAGLLGSCYLTLVEGVWLAIVLTTLIQA